MSVTELHLLPDDLRPVVDSLVGDSLVVDSLEVDLLVVEPLEPPAEQLRRTPSIAMLILDHAPEWTEVSHLYEDFEIVLIAHDAVSAVRILEGMAAVLVPPTVIAPPTVLVLPVLPVTPLVDDALPAACDPVHVVDQLGLTLDEVHHLASWQGRPLPLTSRERAILGCLLGDPGRVWTYRELFEHAWGGYYLGDPALVHSALKRVRRKIKEAGVALTIDAVRGVGFRAQPDT